MNAPAFDMISERVSQLDEQIAQQDMAIKFLRAEREELLVALKVIKRFAGEEALSAPPTYAAAQQGMAASLDVDSEKVRHEREIQKDEVRLTTPEMIVRALAEHGALDTKDLLMEVRKRYWREAPASSVGPTAWRMWKAGRLTKGENGYSLPNEERSAVTAADPSERSDTGGNGSLFRSPRP